ncbi:hypothetical protein [Bacillus salipaludis]|uniref:Uncharacterized protein n=1 Tax=Bacillus salipaludis TaxID=2547811 RepID=A0AA90TWP2_9BACI|nr:hypothetical protein [Bacillus salipaludis]MDQ6600903.1 hypothetical protein [Bacillus salipaludis]
MRNDSIERSFNDSILTIVDYLLQRSDKAKIQKDMETRRNIRNDFKKIYSRNSSISNDEREEGEYELYYAFIKKHQPELFVKGKPVEIFPVDRDKSSFQVLNSKGFFYGVFKQEGKDAHRVTRAFDSKEEVLLNTFGTSRFEKFRGYSFFHLDDGKTYSLKDNKQFRFNLTQSFKPQLFYENIEHARSIVVKEELKNEVAIKEKSLNRTFMEYQIPLDLIGKTITINNISKDELGVRISIEENDIKKDIMLPDLSEVWMERISKHPRMKAAFDELVMDSRSIGEGFLAFYGMEINKEFQKRQFDFEVISNEEGSYIGKLYGDGCVKKLSSYFLEGEAKEHLEKLNTYIQENSKRERQMAKEDIGIEFMEMSEND